MREIQELPPKPRPRVIPRVRTAQKQSLVKETEQQKSGAVSRWGFYVKIIVFFALLFWFGLFASEKIDLATADLGRHLENGKWVAENHFNLQEKNSPVHENFYSYTHPDFPVVNHHWASGVIFYFVHKMTGFSGLSLFYVLLSLLAFVMFFYIAKEESDFFTATLLSLLLVPLMAERKEIRPEVFSALLAGFFYLILWEYNRGTMTWRWLLTLPILMVFWVNLNVYFFLGFFLIGVFLVIEIWKAVFSRLDDAGFLQTVGKIREIMAISILCTIAALVNPFGWKGLVYPLGVFKNYEYTIVENKSVGFVENYGIVNSNFLLIKVVIVLFILSFVVLLLVDRKKISFANLTLAVFFGLMGWFAIRNFTLLGFFALPVLAANVKNIFSHEKEGDEEKRKIKEEGLALSLIVVFIFSVFGSWQFLEQHWRYKGFGLLPRVNAATDFLKNNDIKGPIFNDYDIGGYLIFNLPDQKVFVDNRPAEYPGSFFKEVYKPMQEKMDIFKKVDEEYNFNAIVFYRNDITPWAQNFLKSMENSQGWSPVFTDDYAIIYLKRNAENKGIIDKFGKQLGNN